MHQTPWNKPVIVAGQAITNPRQALTFMDRHWPCHKRLSFADAHLACLAALDGRTRTEDARARFEQAVDEAQLH